MGTNINSQIVSVNFQDTINSQIVNRLVKGVLYPGIYSGGWLTFSGLNVYVQNLVAIIRDSTGLDDCVRVETTSSAAAIAASALAPYIVLDWEYTQNPTNNFVEIQAVSAPAANQLVLGKCNISGGSIVSIDYALRSQAPDPRLNFQVIPESPTSVYVWVLSGVRNGARTLPQRVQVTSFTAGTTYVYLDGAGVAQYSLTPPSALIGYTLLAAIVNTGAQSTVSSSMIVDLRQNTLSNVPATAMGAKAFVNFTPTIIGGSVQNGACVINNSFNVASVTRVSQGVYTIAFTNPMVGTGYLVTGNGSGFVNGLQAYWHQVVFENWVVPSSQQHPWLKTTSQVQVILFIVDGYSTGAQDNASVSVSVFEN